MDRLNYGALRKSVRRIAEGFVIYLCCHFIIPVAPYVVVAIKPTPQALLEPYRAMPVPCCASYPQIPAAKFKAGRCGTYHFWDNKTNKCKDARAASGELSDTRLTGLGAKPSPSFVCSNANKYGVDARKCRPPANALSVSLSLNLPAPTPHFPAYIPPPKRG